MHDPKFDGVDQTLQSRRELSLNRRSKGIIGKNTANHTERNRAANAAHVERIQRHRVKGPGSEAPALTYIPAKLQSAVKSIESVLEAVAPYQVDDIGDWVTCTAFTGAEDVEDIATAAADKFGGCPAPAIYAHFNIPLDPSRVFIKPPQIGDWCVIQCFRGVSLSKLQLVQQITTAYWPTRRLHFAATRERFEASAHMFEHLEDAYFEFPDEWWGDGHVDSRSHALMQTIDHVYQTHRDRFTGLMRYSTTQEDRVDVLAKWGQP